MGGGCKHKCDRGGLFPHLVPPYPNNNNSYGYPNYPSPGGYGYPPAGYPHPSHVYPPPPAYPGSSAPCYPGHGGHKHGMGTFLAGGAAAVAAAYGARHMPHHGYGSHGYGHSGYHHHHHHGKFKHYKFKRAKFGKRWKHQGMYGKHKMWK